MSLMSNSRVTALELMAAKIRRNVLDLHAARWVCRAGCGTC